MTYQEVQAKARDKGFRLSITSWEYGTFSMRLSRQNKYRKPTVYLYKGTEHFGSVYLDKVLYKEKQTCEEFLVLVSEYLDSLEELKCETQSTPEMP